MENKIILPAEWYPQSAVQLTWPHEETDWAPILDEVIPCFVSIAKEVIKHEKLLIVCPDEQVVRRQLGDVDDSRIIFREMATNDTWARDHGGITVFDQGEPAVYDFVFNGWGMKYVANLDNLITRNLAMQGTFADGIPIINMQPFILEGGSIESDGKGTLLTTVECLSSVNRNEYLQKEELEAYLKDVFGFERILWLAIWPVMIRIAMSIRWHGSVAKIRLLMCSVRMSRMNISRNCRQWNRSCWLSNRLMVDLIG